MKMRHVTCMLLILLVAGLLAACDGSNTTNTSLASTATLKAVTYDHHRHRRFVCSAQAASLMCNLAWSARSQSTSACAIKR